MIVLLWLSFILLPIAFGMGILTCFYRKQSNYGITFSESYVLGVIVCIGLAEMAHLTGLFAGFLLSQTGVILGSLITMVLVLALVFVIRLWTTQKERFFEIRKLQSDKSVVPFLFIVVFFLQCLFIYCMKAVVTPGDITLETVQSFLAEDGIYRVMPLTGEVSEAGMPFRYTILCLPTLYSLLCRVFQVEPELLVCHIIPIAVLAASYLGYFYLSGVLFGEKSFKKRYLFLLFVACLFVFTDRGVFSNGYSALHSGYLGVSVRNLVLIPYAFAAALEKRWWKVVMCVLAEACITWTLWGCGVCLVILVGMLLLTILDAKCSVVHQFMQIFRSKEDLS